MRYPNIAVLKLHISFYFGKTDFWINQPSLSADTTGEPWSHATPGFVTISVDEPLVASTETVVPGIPGSFSATQELSTARINATVGLARVEDLGEPPGEQVVEHGAALLLRHVVDDHLDTRPRDGRVEQLAG